ncbi:MAG: fimbrillin family protein [Prevotella sp.]|nr:fimbrillin family protein [Prevotella sp.]
MKRKYYIRMIVCSLAALVLTACTDDIDSKGSSQPLTPLQIGFMAQSSQDWSRANKTRSGNEQSFNRCVPIQGSDFSLQINEVSGINEYFDGGKGVDALVGESGTTRGVPLNSGDVASFYQKMGVFTYTYTGSWDGTQTPNYMYNVEEVKGDDGIYASATKYYWPDESQNMRFYAYAPYNGDINTESKTYLSVSSSSTAGVPQLTYEVPADAEDQKDLMVADDVIESSGILRQSVWNLKFRHILTAVQFMVGEGIPDGKITKVTIKNVVGKGTFYYHNVENGVETTQDHWVLESDKTSFSQTLDFTTTGQQNILLVSGEKTFMMIPQELSNDAAVEIEMTDSESNTTTLSATIGGTGSRPWVQGATITYSLSKEQDEYILEVTSIGVSPYTGQYYELYVTSYVNKLDGTQSAVPWTLEFYDEDNDTWSATWPSAFFDILHFSDQQGGTSQQNFDVDVHDQTPTNSLHVRNLQNHTARIAFDLSKHTYNVATGDYDETETPMTTANCYIVNAPGTYKLPLVYGNGVRNGTTNTQSFNPDGTASARFLKPFVNHQNSAITDPWITSYTSAFTISDAVLVWQDADGLVTPASVKLTDSGTYLEFEVPSATICQGNAIVAVRDSEGKIAWSWHIWVTDENVYKTIEVINYARASFDVMPVNLGWCSIGGADYPARSVKVRVVQQAERGKKATFDIKQTEYLGSSTDDNTRGNCPWYQWGRKDPQPGGDGMHKSTRGPLYTVGSKIKKCYYYNDYTFENAAVDDGNYYTLGQSIQAAGKRLSNGHYCEWINTEHLYNNLWNGVSETTYESGDYASDVSDKATTGLVPFQKTVYDPCPIGFHVADYAAFFGFTKNDPKGYNDAPAVNYKEITDWGVWLYTDRLDLSDDKKVFFPTVGFRNVYGNDIDGICYAGLQSDYWTAQRRGGGDSWGQMAGTLMEVDLTRNPFSLFYNRAACYTTYSHCIRPVMDVPNPITYSPTVNPWDESQGETTVPMSSN